MARPTLLADMSEPVIEPGRILHVKQQALRGLQTLEIGTGRGTFPIVAMGKPGPKEDDEVLVHWRNGLPRKVTWRETVVLWQERFCDLCGHSNAEHDENDCRRLAHEADRARIAANGECPVHDAGLVWASCNCPPLTP